MNLLLYVCCAPFAFFCFVLVVSRFYFQCKKRRLSDRNQPKSFRNVAFLHPHCAGGGGGERVLWDAIQHLLINRTDLKIAHICIYTAADSDGKVSLPKVLQHVQSRFQVTIPSELHCHLSLIPIRSHWIVDPKYHPFATLFTQSVSAIILALEGLLQYTPHIFIDTTGFAFTYPIVKLLSGAKVISYTHYPIISTDMIGRITNRNSMYNNRSTIATSSILSFCKYIYYHIFALLYGAVGFFSNICIVNSTWTYQHIRDLWMGHSAQSIHIVYPPCDVKHLAHIDLNARRDATILSVGQFRPEKNHSLQIRAFSQLCQNMKDSPLANDLRLILVGGVRNDGDKKRVSELRLLISELSLDDRVIIKENLPFKQLLELFQNSFVGLHTMRDEHFGICLVEYIMAGLVMVGHCSGGPFCDIVDNHPCNDASITQSQCQRGFLCTTVDEYTAVLETVFRNYENGKGWLQMRRIAKEHVMKNFTSDLFKQRFAHCFQAV